MTEPCKLGALDVRARPGDLLGASAAAGPAGIVGDRPVGVQVTGEHLTDHRCLAVAAGIECLRAAPTPIDLG
jgi:Asp-tRNA(Asn)/Glu-tRNA(Gln) amidotransferase A subunit family amidase